MSRDWNALGVTHRFLADHVKPGSFAVDATAGNGGDTAFLCRLVGEGGRVLAMDIQPQAVENTRARLLAEGLADIGQVVLADHARLGQLVPPESADCIVFNFGWLPGGDHEVFTRKETSVPAVRQALESLRPGGILTLCLYYGRNNGYQERDALLELVRGLDHRRFTVMEVSFSNRVNDPPIPIWIVKEG